MATKDKIIEVAKYFIKKSQAESFKDSSKSLDALKLQKVLYYAKAWNLVLNKGKKLFVDDFQAWIHGPANAKVWHYFKGFNFSSQHPEIMSEKLELITEEDKKVLDLVWDIYGKFDGKYLEMLTHSEDPWLKARQGLSQDSVSQNVITDEAMKSYYGRRYEEAKARA
jgi:uncharacterized phage-associated protein